MKKLKRHPDSVSWFTRAFIFLCVMVVIASVLLLVLVFFTNLCSLEAIEVKGNQHISSEIIRSASGLKTGDNLITMNVSKAAENLLKNSWIQEVDISRHLLNRVTITVKERKPVARVNFSEVLYLVDGTGFVISNEITGDTESIPAIYAGKGAKCEIGKYIKGGSVKKAVELIDSMPDRVYVAIDLCNPFDGRGFVFNAKAGYQIIYGEYEETKKKNELVEAILLDIEANKRNVSYIDVRVTDSPVTGQ